MLYWIVDRRIPVAPEDARTPLLELEGEQLESDSSVSRVALSGYRKSGCKGGGQAHTRARGLAQYGGISCFTCVHAH